MTVLATEVDGVYRALASTISSGKKSSTAMCGGISVVLADGETRIFKATANYSGTDYHVEIDLMSKLGNWTHEAFKARYNLPPGCTVYLYVYDSPCERCADKLSRIVGYWRTQFGNGTVKWALGFSQYYTGDEASGPSGRFKNATTADSYYQKTFAGWTLTKVAVSAAAAAVASTTTTATTTTTTTTTAAAGAIATPAAATTTTTSSSATPAATVSPADIEAMLDALAGRASTPAVQTPSPRVYGSAARRAAHPYHRKS